MSEPETSVRSIVMDWFNEEVDLPDDFTLRDLCRLAFLRFGEDESFKTRLTEEYFTRNELLYSLMQQRVADTRRLGQLVRGNTKSINTRLSHWERYFEHVENRHKRLMSMSKADLLVAAAARHRRGSHELLLAKLWAQLAAPMTDEEVVADRYTVEQIECAYQEVGR